MADVSRNTMSFAIPEELRRYIDERVQSGEYGNTSEYLRDLIRRDRREQAALRLRSLIADGLESGEAFPRINDRDQFRTLFGLDDAIDPLTNNDVDGFEQRFVTGPAS